MKALLSLSGGLDSSTLLADMMQADGYKAEEILAISFFYSSKHGQLENQAAWAVARNYGVTLRILDLSLFIRGLKSALMSSSEEPVPEGHYESESMKQTVVPGRNLIFLSILSALAQSEGIPEVYVGIHAGDHLIYPDCRPGFFYDARSAVWKSSEEAVTLKAPFLHMNKRQIVSLGLKLGVPYRFTRTCYSAKEVACGRCGACSERREAFQHAGVPDPVEYEYAGPLPEKPAKGGA